MGKENSPQLLGEFFDEEQNQPSLFITIAKMLAPLTKRGNHTWDTQGVGIKNKTSGAVKELAALMVSHKPR